jgi:hypothetical protein
MTEARNGYGVTDPEERNGYAVTARPLGPWVRLYADVVDRKAHYDDHQFRSLIEVLAMAVRLHGHLPARRALAAREGQDEIDFLFSEGDLEELPDGSVTVHRWSSYQPDPTGKERQQRYRDRNAPLPLLGVTRNDVPSDRDSSSTPTTPLRGNDGGVQGGNEDDPVVTYYSLTTRYPKGNALAWVKRLGDDYGFAASSEKMRAAWHHDDNIGTLLSRTEDILVASGRVAELAEQADERERLRQKRATRRAPADVPAPERVGKLMDDIRKVLNR